MSFPESNNNTAASGADRRRRNRTSCNSDRLSKVLLAAPDGTAGQPVVTCVVDYSMFGMGLIHPAEIKPGEQFYVDTETKPGQLFTRRLLRCSRCTPMDGGRFLIGAEFLG
jgi:hypothetical protein